MTLARRVGALLDKARRRAETVRSRILAGTERPPRERWGLPPRKELSRGRRKRTADSLRLTRLSASWRTRVQLRRLKAESRGERESFRFAVLGDVEPGRFWVFRKLFNRAGAFERQVREIQTLDVDFSIQLGDMVSRGIRANYLRFFRELSRWKLTVPYLTVIGNHDRRFPHGRCDSELYRASLGPTNYAFDRGPARFAALDTSAGGLRASQLDWLDRVLDTPLRKIVFMHMPPACLRQWTSWGGLQGIGGFARGGSEMTRLFSERRVDRVYVGHIHAFGVQDYLGVRYILTGGGGSPLFPSGATDRFHHYLVAEVGPDGVSETVRLLSGGTLSIPKAKVLLSR